MTRTAGTIQDGELWLRCPFCGDSDLHPGKAHLSLNLATNLYHCHRCGKGGKLSKKEREDWGIEPTFLVPSLPHHNAPALLDILPGPGSTRPSLLPRYHLSVAEGLVDVFQMTTLRGQLRGYHLRPTWERRSFRSQGQTGFGVPTNLKVPIRLVEGPYDVLTLQDVCTFGFPKTYHLKALKSIRIILCPDGDVWQDPEKTRTYFSPFLEMETLLSILAIEYIPGGRDPDEVPVHQRIRYEVPPRQLRAVLRRIRS